MAREMNIRFTTSSTQKTEFLSSLAAAAEEAKRIASGEEKAQTLDELIAED